MNALFPASIKSHLVLLIFLMAALPTLVLFLFAHRTAKDMSLALETQSLEGVAQSGAAVLHRKLLETMGFTRRTASKQEVLQAVEGEEHGPAQDLFRDAMAVSDAYWAVFAFDRNGDIQAGVTADGQNLKAVSVSNRDYYKAILSDRALHLSSVFQSANGDMIAFSMAAAVHDAQGLVKGGTVTIVNYEHFARDVVEWLQYRGEGYGMVIDPEGRFLTPPPGVDPYSSASDTPLPISDDKPPPLTIRYEYDGAPMLASMVSEPLTGWRIFVAAPGEAVHEAALAHTKNIAHPLDIVLAGAIVCLLVLGLAAAWLQHLVLRPWSDTLTLVRNMASGTSFQDPEDPLLREMRDFSEHVRTLARDLKNVSGFAKGVLNGVGHPCCIADLEHRIIFVNRPFLDLAAETGAPEDYTGQKAHTIFPFQPAWADATEPVLAEGHTREVEVNAAPRLRRRRRLHGVLRPCDSPDGTRIGVVSLWTDMTARHETDEQHAREMADMRQERDELARSLNEAAAHDRTVDRLLQEPVPHLETALANVVQAETALAVPLLGVTEKAQRATNHITHTDAAARELEHTALSCARGAADVRRHWEAMQSQTGEAVGRAEVSTADVRSLEQAASPFSLLLEQIKNLAVQANLMALKVSDYDAASGDRRPPATYVEESGKLAHEATRLAQDARNWLETLTTAVSAVQSSMHALARAASQSHSLVSDTAPHCRDHADKCQQAYEMGQRLPGAPESGDPAALLDDVDALTQRLMQLREKVAQATEAGNRMLAASAAASDALDRPDPLPHMDDS